MKELLEEYILEKRQLQSNQDTLLAIIFKLAEGEYIEFSASDLEDMADVKIEDGVVMING